MMIRPSRRNASSLLAVATTSEPSGALPAETATGGCDDNARQPTNRNRKRRTGRSHRRRGCQAWTSQRRHFNFKVEIEGVTQGALKDLYETTKKIVGAGGSSGIKRAEPAYGQPGGRDNSALRADQALPLSISISLSIASARGRW